MYCIFIVSFVCVFFFLMIRRPPRSTRTDNSFPTRRSSDLHKKAGCRLRRKHRPFWQMCSAKGLAARKHACRHRRGGLRSEEHTSELQSLMRISYAVFCLKKKKKKNITSIDTKTNRNKAHDENS